MKSIVATLAGLVAIVTAAVLVSQGLDELSDRQSDLEAELSELRSTKQEPVIAPTAGHAAEDFRVDMFSLSTIAYELLTLAIPYEGLGGQAGTPQLVAKTADSYLPPSGLIANRDRLPRSALSCLDDCIGRGLRLHPDERFDTSSEWLSAWDALHNSMQKGSRLTRMEEFFVAGIDSLVRLLPRRNRK